MSIEKDIIDKVSEPLNRAGIFYRIFSRTKSQASIDRKMKSKGAKYSLNKQKMQDIIGLRLVLYFKSDVELISNYFEHLPSFDSKSDSSEELTNAQLKLRRFIESQDTIETPDVVDFLKLIPDLTKTVFMPVRLNLVCRMNEEQTQTLHYMPEFQSYPDLIDNTFELQIRTVLSEGWHEVEHDLRYKCKEESWWKECEEESRALNGIFAALESSEISMQHLFQNIAHKNYKKHLWSPMIRNQFCIRLLDYKLSDAIEAVLNDEKNEVAKRIHRCSRKKLLGYLLSLKEPYPLNMNNVVFLLNRIIDSPNKTLMSLEPKVISEKLNRLLGQQNK